MAISTKGVTLKIKKGAAFEKLVDIKAFPDLGAAPELLDATTLSDAAQVFVQGIQTTPALEFTANYSKDDYDAVMATAGAENEYQLVFGDAGSFSWKGTHTAWVVGSAVNTIVDMKLSIAPSTPIAKTEASAG